MLMFPDASVFLGGCCLTQVPVKQVVGGIPVVAIRNEPPVLLSGAFRVSQLC